MTVFSNNGADLLLHWNRIACALLGTMVCLGASDSTAGGRNENNTVAHTERFAFTGVYRFAFPPAPSRSASLMTHPLMSVSSRDESAAARHVAIINAPATNGGSGNASNRIATITTRPSVPGEGRASLGGPTPKRLATTTHGATNEDQVRDAAPLTQIRPMRAAVAERSLHSDMPPVHIALSKPGNAAHTEAATRDLAATRSLAGRIIDVPPLPELYQRPASQRRIRPVKRPYRSRRATGGKSYSKSAKSTHPKSTPAGASQTNWMKKAVFVTD